MTLRPSTGIRAFPGALLRRFVSSSLLRLGIIGLLGGLIAVSCTTGTYPLDIFYEMHYQPTYHSQEPPRLLPPVGAVPITGKEVPLQVSPDHIDSIVNPIPGEGIYQGAKLFAINCSMCHGMGAMGDGEVLQIMIDDYGYTPKLNTNLTLVNIFGYSEGLLYTTITNRDFRPEIAALDPGTNVVMPQFQKLLTAEERWMLVNYLNTLGGS